jgi:hypothetical protein
MLHISAAADDDGTFIVYVTRLKVEDSCVRTSERSYSTQTHIRLDDPSHLQGSLPPYQ